MRAVRALVTPGNRHDSPFLPPLIQGLTPSLIIADAGYDSKEKRRPWRRLEHWLPSLETRGMHANSGKKIKKIVHALIMLIFNWS